MRIIVFVIILLIGLVSFAWYTQHYLETSSEAILKEINLYEGQVKEEIWQEAEASLDKINSHWHRIKTKWKVVLDHRETDEIGLALGRLESFTFVEDQGAALAELYALRFLLEHIPKKERLLLRNIF